MKDWVKIQTFQRIHQAELRKDILEENGISAVIINEKDSLFLLGEIELYVKEFDAARAKKLIGEFDGLTKINSFVGEKQITQYFNLLKDKGLNPIFKRKQDAKFILDNFEIYVKNEELEDFIPFLKDENIEGWSKVRVCDSVSQTKYRTDLLDENNIDNFVIKHKDSHYHMENVEIFVRTEELEKAKRVLDNLNSWVAVRKYYEKQFAKQDEDVLNENNIKALIENTEDNKFAILVEANNEEAAIDLINRTKEWVIVKVFSSIENAQIAKEILKSHNINSVIVNERDSSFLLGEIELYVAIDKKSQADSLVEGL